MRIVFMGTPQFAADILGYLFEDKRHEVIEVITKPDQIRARGNKKIENPVKSIAIQNNKPILEWDLDNDDDVINELKRLCPDAIVVVAFGRILKQEILDIPKYGCINIHGSQLPNYRGPAPFQWSILNGEPRAYACIMKMDKGMDTGDHCGTTSISINDKYLHEIEKELAHPAYLELVGALSDIEAEQVVWHKQYPLVCPPTAPMLGKQFLYLRFDDSAEYAKRKVRASDSSHPVKCNISGRNVTILRASLPKEKLDINKYEVKLTNNKLYIRMDDGALEIEELRPDGKNSMDGKSFALGIQNGDYSWKELR